MSLKALNRLTTVFNLQRGKIEVRNGANTEDPAEILIYEDIGKDPWTGNGMTAADFKKALDLCKGKAINIRVNSPGGMVDEGMAIKSLIDEWPQKVTCTIDGIAASTASWMCLGADEVKAPKHAQIFIHDAIAFCYGNAEQLQKTADDLDKCSDQIAGMYADKNGKSAKEMRDLMKQETLMTAQEAKDLGLIDTITDGSAARNFTPEEITAMKNRLAHFRNSISAAQQRAGNQQNQTQIMNREQMIALLNSWGVKFSDKATDAELVDLVKAGKPVNTATAPDNSSKIAELENRIAKLTEAENSAKKLRIENAIDKLILNDQLTKNERDAAIKRALADESYLDELNARPVNRPGANPLRATRVELTGESFKDVSSHILNIGTRTTMDLLRNSRGTIEERDRRDIVARGMEVTNVYRKHRDMLQQMFNTNNIDADLQRTVLLQEMLEEFVVPLIPLQQFSLVFSNVPLEGTDKVGVPFYPLQTAAAQSFNPATGYNTFADTNTNIREVAVGGGGANSGSSAAANTAKDRKYLGMAFDSYTLNRQPFFNVAKLAQQNANKLAVDIIKDIISRVITAANYGASIKAVPAAAFSSDDVADLYGAATGANWPMAQRSLTLDHTYNVSLLKDPTFKQYLAAGTTDALRKAQIQQAYGFEDIPIVPNLTNYSPANEYLIGWIVWRYAMLVAFAPIMPTPEVRTLLTRYDVVADPKTGAFFEYRQMADAQMDQSQYVVESSYGAGLGVASALKRLTSQ
jgi:ATP-dependent protease ClpP protease subunit